MACDTYRVSNRWSGEGETLPREPHPGVLEDVTAELSMASKTMTIRLSEQERQALEAAAEAAQIGPCALARQSVVVRLGFPRPSAQRRPDARTVAVGKALGELGRIGNNVNQLARHAHVGGRVDSQILVAVRSELEALTMAVMASGEKQ